MSDETLANDRRSSSPANRQRRAVFDLELEASVCVGRARPSVAELAALGQGDLLALEDMPHGLVELRVGDQVVARGTLEEMDDGSDRLALRIVEVFEGAAS
jgi:flagellar motor switch protein FliN